MREQRQIWSPRRRIMLFAIHYRNAAHGDEAREKRTLKFLTAWKPPAGFDMKSWYDYADGSGGLAIVDAPSPEVLMEAVAPWATFFDFSAKPIVPVEKSTPIFERGIAWRDSIR
jgi:hypothetical protein